MLQRAIDRKLYHPPHDRPVLLWGDDFQTFTIDRDSAFQAGCRSKGLCVVRACQNLPIAILAYGHDGKTKVEGLLGNHSTNIWHRNDCVVTNTWAADVISKETVYCLSLSNSGSNGGLNTSMTHAEEYACPPQEYQSLKNGGPANKFTVARFCIKQAELGRRIKTVG
jgi:hypothetical protein